MTDMHETIDIVDFADKLADKYHKGQKRKDGQPYITHPRAVARIAEHLYDPTISYDTCLPMGRELPLIKAVCLTHDVLEDCKHLICPQKLRVELEEEFSVQMVDNWMDALTFLNKDNYLTYCVYITTIKHHKLSTLAKLCDLEHNVSDLQKGSMRDKYELAQYLLTH